MAKPATSVGISAAALATLGAGLYLNLYLLIAAGLIGLSAAAWLATEPQ